MGWIDQSPHAGVKGEFDRKQVPPNGKYARVGSCGPEEEGLDPDRHPKNASVVNRFCHVYLGHICN